MQGATSRAQSAAGRRRSVAGIVFDGASFLLAKRKESGKMGGRWEFAGGKAEEGETLTEAVVREFKEETGLAVAAGRVICSVEFETEEGPADLYALSVELPKGFSIESASFPEHTEAAWFSIEEIASLNLVDSDRKLLPGLKRWIASRSSSLQ